MDNLLRSAYAKRSDASPLGKTWYIPHQAVYHPSKPGKVRVVFDCSAEFQEKSINEELLSGQNLTNQIIGILTRFLEEKNCVHGRCRSHVSSSPGTRLSAVSFRKSVVGES